MGSAVQVYGCFMLWKIFELGQKGSDQKGSESLDDWKDIQTNVKDHHLCKLPWVVNEFSGVRSIQKTHEIACTFHFFGHFL